MHEKIYGEIEQNPNKPLVVEVEDIKEVIVRACEANINVLYIAEPSTERCELVKKICEQYKNNFIDPFSRIPQTCNHVFLTQCNFSSYLRPQSLYPDNCRKQKLPFLKKWEER